MRVTVRYFAIVRELVGRAVEERELPSGTTAGSLLEQLARDHPVLEQVRRSTMLMVNYRYVSNEHVLAEGDEVALIPPVSGGAGPFAISAGPLDLESVARAVAWPRAGAIVTFAGTVREIARGKRVRYLEYEAYPPAAERSFQQIAEEIRQRWGIEQVAIVHRVGRVEVGEASVAIAVASPHRAEAFEACRYAIDRLKQIAPIWKKEVYEDGETWIGSEAAYQEAFGHSVPSRD
jgi:molybdopterin synthase catalytic subunit